jgi:hypothetical protein
MSDASTSRAALIRGASEKVEAALVHLERAMNGLYPDPQWFELNSAHRELTRIGNKLGREARCG